MADAKMIMWDATLAGKKLNAIVDFPKISLGDNVKAATASDLTTTTTAVGSISAEDTVTKSCGITLKNTMTKTTVMKLYEKCFDI